MLSQCERFADKGEGGQFFKDFVRTAFLLCARLVFCKKFKSF